MWAAKYCSVLFSSTWNKLFIFCCDTKTLSRVYFVIANNSLDIGFAVYHAEYKISAKGYQEDADQEILKRLMRFLKTDTDDAEGKMTWGGDDDLNAYFFDEAFNMFMRECPAVLTGFKKVRDDIKSSN